MELNCKNCLDDIVTELKDYYFLQIILNDIGVDRASKINNYIYSTQANSFIEYLYRTKFNQNKMFQFYIIEFVYSGSNKMKAVLDDIKEKYKLFFLFYTEEFYFCKEIEEIIQYSIEIELPLFIFSRNPVNKFFLDKRYNSKINANTFEMSFRIPEYETNAFIDVKDIKLLFLNFNRSANRDYIICELNRRNELYNPENYISFHNHLSNWECNETIEKYEITNTDYSKKYNIDFDFLRELKIIPKFYAALNEHNNSDLNNKDPKKSDADVQSDAYNLYMKSKFNIICEYYFGSVTNKDEYSNFNYILTNKTIFPLLFKNVFYIQESNDTISKNLEKLGFQIFFWNIEDFFLNLNDNFYYSEIIQQKLNHNRELAKDLLINSKKEIYNSLYKIIFEKDKLIKL